MRLIGGFNELAAEIEARGPQARPDALGPGARARAVPAELSLAEHATLDHAVRFIHALRGMTNKGYGRGEGAPKTYRTLMPAACTSWTATTTTPSACAAA